MFGKKSFVSFIEMVIVIIALFIAFSIFFPGFQYKSRWSDALLLSKNRDIILTADRIVQLYNYSFNSTNLQNFLDSLLVKEAGMIAWSETEGAIKSRLWIACNCTNDDLNNMMSWFKGLSINGREIEILPCYTNLEAINPCLSSSDILLIFGNKTLSSPVYLNTLSKYIKSGSGIVEVADWDPNTVLSNNVQKTIFGLGAEANPEQKGNSTYDEFRDEVASPIKRPINATAISYQPWKYFYHIPIPLLASTYTGSIPIEGLPAPSCTSMSNGSFAIQASIKDVGGQLVDSPNSYKFWICDSSKVYFDTDLNDSADVVISAGEGFGIVDYYNRSLFWNFTMNYVDGQDKIGISFKPNYRFSDFITWHESECVCPPDMPGKGKEKKCQAGEVPPGWCRGGKSWAGKATNLIGPGDGNWDRVFIQASNVTKNNNPIPGVILNTTSLVSRVAWIANFTSGGVGDDERLLFLSLLLWASNKRSNPILQPTLKIGFKTSYINSVNTDMFEVYKFNLGLGYPF